MTEKDDGLGPFGVEAIAMILKACRESKKLTQAQVAAELKMSAKHYQALESGKVDKFGTLLAALKYFECEIVVSSPAVLKMEQVISQIKIRLRL